MSRPIRISILANGSQARREVTSLGTTLKNTLGTAGVIAGGAGVVAAFKSLRDQASAAQQSVGAVESVFKQYADTVERRSREAADAYGLSANEYREQASLLGALFKGQGVELDKLAGKTDKMIGVASDLAATFGGTTKDAVDALSSAFKGETDPIERYGISIKQSDVTARLAAKGQDKLTGAARKQAEQVARTELILNGAKDAQGQFARESDTLAVAQQKLNAKWKNAQAELGKRLLPALTDVTNWLGDNLPEALDRTEAGLESVGDVVGPVVKWLNDLPAPLKEVAAQAAIAAIVLPRLAGAATGAGTAVATLNARVRQNYAEMTYAATRTAKMQSALSGLGGTARTVAGIGGMVALTQGAQGSDDALGALTKTAGGAAVGFSLAGPWGAAIGGAAGALWGLHDATKVAWDSTRGVAKSTDYAKASLDGYRDTLDETTGAITKMTRARVLDNLQASGVIATATSMGIATRDLVGSILGNEGAIKRVSKAWSDQDSVMGNLIQRNRLQDWLAEQGVALEKDQAAIRKRNDDLKTWGEALRGIPKSVQTELKQLGYAPTLAQVRQLKREYGLTPKQVQTILKATGVAGVNADLKGVKKNIGEVGDARPDLDPMLGALRKGMGTAKTTAARGASDVRGSLRDGTAKARPNLSPFVQVLNAEIARAKGRASSGGSSIGAALADGASAAVLARAGKVGSAAAKMVTDAIAAANAAGDIRSPSRKTRQTGNWLAEGVIVGVDERGRAVRASGSNLVKTLLSGLDDGAAGVRSSLGKVEREIQKSVKRLTGKAMSDKAAKDMSRWLATASKELQAQAKKYAAQVARVEAQQQRVKDLIAQRNDYAASVRANAIAFADITGVGKDDEGRQSARSITQGLADRLSALLTYQQQLQALRTKYKLNATTYQQLVDAGVEGGSETVRALTEGGQQAVSTVNTLQGKINAAAGTLGTQTSRSMHQAGIDSANGLLKGMRSKESAIYRQATKMARQIVRAVRKELKSASPSKKMVAEGVNATDGIVIGLDAERVRRRGELLAKALEKGFSQPQLAAHLAESRAAATAGAGIVTVRLTAEQVSQVQRGREIQLDLDAYRRAGGRVAS